MGHDAATNPAAPPPSRLLQHLIQEAGTAQDQQVWARAVCLAAAHQARAGMLDEAPVSLGLVREAYGPGVNPETACWLILSEGILQWCLFDASHGYARMRGAHALAMSMGADSAASCAAWMALLEFNASQYDRMALHLTEVFEHARSDDHLARARAALVIATSHHVAGNDVDARRWYQRCRNLSSIVGDEATTGAIFHNMASCHLANLRLQAAFAPLEDKALDQVRQEVSNTVTFDLITRNNTQRVWRELVQARMALLAQDYPAAREYFRIVLASGLPEPYATACTAVDVAWCDVQLDPGSIGVTWPAIQTRYATFPGNLDPDDQACIEMRMAAMAAMAGADEEHAAHLSKARDAQIAHRQFCEEMNRRMAVFG